MRTILGFDIGGSKINIVEGNFKGEILRYKTLLNKDEEFSSIFNKMVRMGKKFINSAEENSTKIIAISVSIGGPLIINKGIILDPPNLSTYKNFNLKKELSNALDLPVFIEHDGNAGALAEFMFGAGIGKKNLIFLTLGTGLGAGIIINGNIYHGTTDTAGEVGHIRIAEQGPTAYRKSGSWEGVSSGVGLVKLLHYKFPSDYPTDITTRKVIQLGLNGDCKIQGVLQELGEWLGKGIAILVDVLNPELVVVGTLGYILGDIILAPARKVVAEEALQISAKACKIVPAKLGQSLGNVASLMAAINHFRVNEYFTKQDQKFYRFKERKNTRNNTLTLLSEKIEKAGNEIINALMNDRKLIVFGNGGSATQAQHFVGELIGRYKLERGPLPAISLSADGGLLSCIGNDYSFEDIFHRQVLAIANEGDVVIGITTSGKSENVVRGLKTAKEKNALTICLTGKSGLDQLSVDYEINVTSEYTAIVQEEHLFIIHSWCEIVDEKFK